MFELINLFVTALRVTKTFTGNAVNKKRHKKAVTEFVSGAGAMEVTVPELVARRYVLTQKESALLQSGTLTNEEVDALLTHAEERYRRAPDAAFDAKNELLGAVA